MKHIKRHLQTALLAIAIAAAGWHVAPAPVYAQESALKIGVLDFEYIFRKSKAGAGLLASVKNSQKSLDDEAAATGKKFREEEKKIQAECQNGPEAECKARQDKFVKDVKAAEDALNDKRKALEKRLVDGKNKITKALEPIVQKIIDKEKYTLVVDRAIVVFRDPSYDITMEALKGLDASLKNI